MLRLLIDENFPHLILRGVKSRLPELDFVSVHQVDLRGSDDWVLLKWAAQNDRTMLTRDFKTMPLFVAELMQRGEATAGVILVPQKMAIRRAIEELELVIACHSQEEFRDRIQRLPL